MKQVVAGAQPPHHQWQQHQRQIRWQMAKFTRMAWQHKSKMLGNGKKLLPRAANMSRTSHTHTVSPEWKTTSHRVEVMSLPHWFVRFCGEMNMQAESRDAGMCRSWRDIEWGKRNNNKTRFLIDFARFLCICGRSDWHENSRNKRIQRPCAHNPTHRHASVSVKWIK